LKYHRGLDEQGDIEEDLQKFLLQQSWKENIRDLIAFLRSIVTLPYEEEYRYTERGELSKTISILEGGSEFSLPESLTRIESAIINRSLELYNGNQTKCSQILGMTSRDIRRKKL
jgi:DNA-binding NtrC family response regulator